MNYIQFCYKNARFTKIQKFPHENSHPEKTREGNFPPNTDKNPARIKER